MLVRMFEKQDKLKLLNYPYSSSRGIQLEWMRSGRYEDGMSPEAHVKWEKAIAKGTEFWAKQLDEAKQQVEYLCGHAVELVLTSRKEQILMVFGAVCVPLGPEPILSYFKLCPQHRNTPCTNSFDSNRRPKDPCDAYIS